MMKSVIEGGAAVDQDRVPPILGGRMRELRAVFQVVAAQLGRARGVPATGQRGVQDQRRLPASPHASTPRLKLGLERVPLAEEDPEKLVWPRVPAVIVVLVVIIV